MALTLEQLLHNDAFNIIGTFTAQDNTSETSISVSPTTPGKDIEQHLCDAARALPADAAGEAVVLAESLVQARVEVVLIAHRHDGGLVV